VKINYRSENICNYQFDIVFPDTVVVCFYKPPEKCYSTKEWKKGRVSHLQIVARSLILYLPVGSYLMMKFGVIKQPVECQPACFLTSI
jgi:hypothetical protein